MTEGNKIAIIGLGEFLVEGHSILWPLGPFHVLTITGPLGLVALKNCLEEGFEATGFDRIPYPGGLWTYTPEDRVSALPSNMNSSFSD